MLGLIFLSFFVHVHFKGLDAKALANRTEKGYDRTTIPRDPFSNDFDSCMINHWTNLSVLNTSPTAACNSTKHSRLCYGLHTRRPGNAQFISCYNTEKLIPEFTAYVVPPRGKLFKYKRPSKFRQDTGRFAPKPQAKHTDWKIPKGAKKDHFCSRGHLTPSGAFNTKEERHLTFTITNVAPQWQPFNGGNWAAVERAVKSYATDAKHEVYVFTGTAGIAKYWAKTRGCIPWRRSYKTGNMTVPKFFWKTVCDRHPSVRQSVVFIAENNVNDKSKTKVTSGTCASQQVPTKMTKKRGVVDCYSVSDARKRYFQDGFKLPDFDKINCGTDNKGNFLDKYLKFS